MSTNREDLLIGEHVLVQKFATREQVDECLALVERMRAEMQLDMTLGDVLAKRGYINPAQLTALQQAFDPAAARRQNVIPGYQLLERVGVGAMGSVYRARDLQLDIPVAIKILRLALASSPTQIERLKREARFVAKLKHDNIVSSRAVGEAGGLHYLVMDYVDGATVRHVLRDGPLAEKTALRIARDVARALQHAHENGIIHRDVKPGNVMQARDGTIKLADFGLARGEAPSDLTLEHASIGTPHYVAPEQMRRAADATARSDLFGLGATLYHMVTGRPPFQGQTLGEIIQNVMACRFVPPEALRPDLSIDATYLIHRLMRADPAERYPDAAAVIADLDKLERGESIAPRTFRGEYREHLSAKRRRTALLAVVALALLAVPIAFWVGHRQAEQDREAHQRYCVARARVGVGKLESVTTLDALRALDREMRDAWEEADTAGCPPSLDLMSRRERVGGLLKRIATAKACATEARTAGNRRVLYERASSQLEDVELGFVRKEIEAAVQAVLGHSRAARQTLDEKFDRATPQSIDDAERRLREYRDQVVNLYVRDGVHRSDAMIKEFQKLRKVVKPDLARDHANKDYENWWIAHARYTKRLRAVLTPHLPDAYRDLFAPASADQITRLENQEWASVKPDVERAVENGDAPRAEAALRSYLGRAHLHRTAARALGDRIKKLASTKSQGEKARLDGYRAEFLAALRTRDYETAVAVGRRARDAKWSPALEGDVLAFKAHTEAYDTLRKLLAGRGVDDPSVATHERLRDILKSIDGIESAVAYFEFGESYAARDPRAGREALLRARRFFEGQGGWELLDGRVGEVNALLARRERDAERILAQRAAAYARKDYLTENRLCERLLKETKGSLRFTDAVDAARDTLETRVRELVSLIGDQLTQDEFGVPAGHVATSPENGVTTVRFDFRDWYPDEDKVPSDVKDKRAWLENHRRKYWYNDRFDGEWTSARKDREYRRACRQLRLFTDELVPDAEGATLTRARFDAEFARTGRAPVRGPHARIPHRCGPLDRMHGRVGRGVRKGGASKRARRVREGNRPAYALRAGLRRGVRRVPG